MGQGRNGHIYAKFTVLAKNKRGVALVNALAFSIITGLLIAGLYIGISTLFRATEEVRTFTSVREAAASGARYAASMVCFIDNQSRQFNLQFRITGREGLGRVNVVVYRLAAGGQTPGGGAGREISGTSRDPVSASIMEAGGGSACTGLFKIISEARFGDQVSRVEAIYLR